VEPGTGIWKLLGIPNSYALPGGTDRAYTSIRIRLVRDYDYVSSSRNSYVEGVERGTARVAQRGRCRGAGGGAAVWPLRSALAAAHGSVHSQSQSLHCAVAGAHSTHDSSTAETGAWTLDSRLPA
jgi:hypothetical protein